VSWTTPADIRAQVQKFWDRGVLPKALCCDENIFPLRLKMKGPGSRDLSGRFSEVRDWIALLTGGAGRYRIEWRRINHRTLGANDIPAKLWIDSMDDCLALIGKYRAAESLKKLMALTGENRPELLPWVRKSPLRVLDLAEDWERLLRVVTWLQKYPRPGVYLRQIDLPGVHSKFIESHRGVLGELFDLALPPETIDPEAKGVAGFCRRYGFRDKPLHVRFRMLDPSLAFLPTGTDQDIVLTRETFAELDIGATRVFITENEINFLAFPPCAGALVIFGAGYGFDNLAAAHWLETVEIHYWGDIDTHGFAILNQLRGFFPHAKSLLMDQATLLAHRELWGVEPRPEIADLNRLTTAEHAIYENLCQNQWGDGVRLEQERIGFGSLEEALGKLGNSTEP